MNRLRSLRSLRGLRRRWWIATGTVLVLLGGVGLWMVLREEAAATTPMTATVTVETVKQTVTADGTLQAARTAELDFEVSGTVTGVLVKPGDTVKKGQVLARVDDAALVATAEAADASLDAAYSQLDTDQDAGASDVQIAADQAALAAAKADLADAAQAVEDAALRATMTGTVAAVEVAKGDRVGSSSPTANTGTDAGTEPAVTLVSTDRYVVEASVAAADVEQVKTGLQAEITVSGVDETVYGTVLSVDLVAEADDSGAAVFPVAIEVTGTRDDLYAGTSATVAVIVSQRPDVLTVSSRALSTEDGKTWVTRLVDGEEVRTEVTTGEAYGMSTEITAGLEEGDVVVLPDVRLPTGGSRQEMPEGFQIPEGFEPPEGFTPGGDFGGRSGSIGGAP